MSLSLIGIIFVQGYWIKNTVETNEEQFSFNAKQLLINVSDQLEREEVDKYYVQYATLADSTKPSSALLSELFHIKQSELTNETFYFTNSILQEDYKLSSSFLNEKRDTVNFKKIVSSKVTRLVRNDELEDQESLSAQERFERISRLESQEKLLLLDAIKEKASELPIYKRLDTALVKSLIDAQLIARDIESDYEFAIYSKDLATKIRTKNFKKDSPGTYGIPIFESTNTNYEFYINFLDKKQEILSSIAIMALLSIVFTLIIIVAYSSALTQLIQKR